MKINEKKICSFTQNGTRLQLLRVIKEDIGTDGIPTDLKTIIYQVRLNRKIIDTSISEYQMRKLFATHCQNIILQLIIY